MERFVCEVKEKEFSREQIVDRLVCEIEEKEKYIEERDSDSVILIK